MKISAQARWGLIGLAALLVLVTASGNLARQGGDAKVVIASEKSASRQKAMARPLNGVQVPQAELAEIGSRTSASDEVVDIFRDKSWYVAPPPPPPAKPIPPPAPTAPPVPYAFMGNYLGDDGRLIIFLTKGDRVYSVSPGDVLDGTYRVEAIVSGQLVLIYLPLNVRQTLSTGEAS